MLVHMDVHAQTTYYLLGGRLRPDGHAAGGRDGLARGKHGMRRRVERHLQSQATGWEACGDAVAGRRCVEDAACGCRLGGCMWKCGCMRDGRGWGRQGVHVAGLQGCRAERHRVEDVGGDDGAHAAPGSEW